MLAANTRQNVMADGSLVKQLIGAGAAWLDQNREYVNRLNVFPVPDGDTGTNMAHTMRSAYRAVSLVEDNHVGKLARALADGALKGARGNSGVILSQIWAGVAEVLQNEPVLTPALLARACQNAVKMAYAAVQDPTEGTILTVSRLMAESIIERQHEQPDLVSLLKRMVVSGRAALRQTPEMLPVLKKAGVVDSGGQGLLFIFEGMLRSMCGRDVTAEAAAQTYERAWREELEPQDAEGYGYDVQFLMRGSLKSIEQVRQDVNDMGWSTLVVGTNDLIKVHVHVHDPGQPLSYAIQNGRGIEDIVVENMQRQYEENLNTRFGHQDDARTDIVGPAVITVASGVGLRRLFLNDLNAAVVIAGGQTMNPSVDDFLRAIRQLPNEAIIVLPNNKNIILTAQQAARIAQDTLNKQVVVIPSTTVPQGIAAMWEYGNLTASGETATLEAITELMRHGLKQATTCEITTAVREYDFEGQPVRAGQWIGLLDDKLAAAGESILDVAFKLLERANTAQCENVVVYYGEGVTPGQAREVQEAIAARYPKQQVELLEGGQPLYPYILSVE